MVRRSRRLEEAREAFRKGDREASKKAHDPRRIVEEMEHEESHRRSVGRYIGDMVYGASDGIVTTFAIVSAVAGANLSASVALILGLANLLADGLSMATGNYLGTKSELEYAEKERKREEWEVEHMPDGEIEEIRQIYARKGFKGEDLERVVRVITSDKKVWIDTMMLEELKIVVEEKSPIKSALATLLSFITAGFIPLLAYVVALLLPGLALDRFAVSLGMTSLALFGVGSLRTLVTGKRWWFSGFEMLLVGGFASSVAYIIGYLLRGLVG